MKKKEQQPKKSEKEKPEKEESEDEKLGLPDDVDFKRLLGCGG